MQSSLETFFFFLNCFRTDVFGIKSLAMKFLHRHGYQIQMMSHTGGCRTGCAGHPVCHVRGC